MDLCPFPLLSHMEGVFARLVTPAAVRTCRGWHSHLQNLRERKRVAVSYDIGRPYQRPLGFPMPSMNSSQRTIQSILGVISTDLCQSEQSDQLQSTMQIAKGNRNRQQNKICWIADEMAHELDALREYKDPDSHCSQKHLPLVKGQGV